MAFDADAFADDVADSTKTVLADFRNNPKTTLANYGLTITVQQSDKIKEVTEAAEAVPDLTVIAGPVMDE